MCSTVLNHHDGVRIHNYKISFDLKNEPGIQRKIEALLKSSKLKKKRVRPGQTYAVAQIDTFYPYVYTLFKNGHVNVTKLRCIRDIVYAGEVLEEALRLPKFTCKARVDNICATGKVFMKEEECLDLQQLYDNANAYMVENCKSNILKHVRFDVNRFPCCNVKTKSWGSLLIFSSGKVVFVGCKTDLDVHLLSARVLPTLINWNCAKGGKVIKNALVFAASTSIKKSEQEEEEEGGGGGGKAKSSK